MATIRYFPSEGAPVLLALHKPLSTIGRALGNDIHLPDASVAHHHAQIVFNGRDFQLEEVDREAEILINGKKKRRARLANGDRITLGKALLGFSMFTELSSAPATGRSPRSTATPTRSPSWRSSASCRSRLRRSSRRTIERAAGPDRGSVARSRLSPRER